jgi:hypothetical protein
VSTIDSVVQVRLAVAPAWRAPSVAVGPKGRHAGRANCYAVKIALDGGARGRRPALTP